MVDELPYKPWTAHEVSDKLLYSDQELQAVARYTNEEVIQKFTAMAQKAGVSPIPPLGELTQQERDEGQQTAVTTISKEGRYYIHLNPNLSTQEALDSLAHELGHVKGNDLAPEKIAAKLNDPTNQISFAEEFSADQQAVMLCRGRGNAAQLQPYLDTYQRLADRFNTTPESKNTARSVQLTQDPTHPFIGDRIDRLNEGAEREEKAGHCPVDPKLISGDILKSFGTMAGGHDLATGIEVAANGASVTQTQTIGASR